jgi:hypothetical protein
MVNEVHQLALRFDTLAIIVCLSTDSRISPSTSTASMQLTNLLSDIHNCLDINLVASLSYPANKTSSLTTKPTEGSTPAFRLNYTYQQPTSTERGNDAHRKYYGKEYK